MKKDKLTALMGIFYCIAAAAALLFVAITPKQINSEKQETETAAFVNETETGIESEESWQEIEQTETKQMETEQAETVSKSEEPSETESAMKPEEKKIPFEVKNKDQVGVRVRENPSMNGKILGVMKYGTTGEVIKYGKIWCYATGDGLEGYVSTSLITLNQEESE